MKKPLMIGIAGTSASGKSTLSEHIKRKLTQKKIRIIHMDEYYKSEAERPVIKGITDGKKYIDDNHPDSLHMDKIRMDIEKASGEDWDIVIVEGLFALYDEKLALYLDLKIYVDCDSDERMRRRIKRHLSFGQDFEEITQRYIQAVMPRQREYVEEAKWRADIIVNGFLLPVAGTEIIISWLNEKLDM